MCPVTSSDAWEAERTFLKKRDASPYLIVFSLWLLVFSASSQIMIISPILPQIGEQLDIADTLLGTLVTAYSLMVGLFAVISGPISDRIGRRRILLMGTGIMVVSLVCHYLVVDYLSFLAVRVFSGAAGGILSGAAVSYIGDCFPYNKRGWAVGWVMSGSAFGQIFGIPLGVVLAGHFGFRAPFYLFAITMALTYILIWLRLPQPPIGKREGRLTLKGAVRDYWAMLMRREIASAAVAFFLVFLGWSMYVVYLPTWLERSLDFSPNQVATLFLVGGIANVISGPQAGKLSDRIGRKLIVLLSCVGLFIVMLGTTLVIRSFWIAYPVFFATMVLIAMRVSPFSALLTALVPDHNRGSLMSLTVALGQVGFGLGGALAGPFYSHMGYGSNTAMGAVSVLGMGLIVWFLVPEPRRDAPVHA
jgi:predicted MFS family arabinose efflux permease